MNQTKIYAQGSTHTIHNGNLVNYNKINAVSNDNHMVNLDLDLNGEKYLVRNLDLNNIHHLEKILPKKRRNDQTLYNKMLSDFDLMEDDIINIIKSPIKKHSPSRSRSTKKRVIKRKTANRKKSPKKSQTRKVKKNNVSSKRKSNRKTKRYSLRPNTFL
jgi:hypothetical protein